MVKVKAGAKVITIVPAQDAYGNISIVKPGGKVITIEPSADALSMEEVDKLVLERFRIIFQAVKDYGSLLGGLREVGGN